MERPIKQPWLEELYGNAALEPEKIAQVRLPQQGNIGEIPGLQFYQGATANRELVWSAKQDPLDDVIVRDCALRGLKGLDGRNRVKWLLRLYALCRATFQRLHLRKVGVEHALYGNLDGDFTLDEFLIEDVASQAAQLAWRRSETDRPELGTVARTVQISRGLILNCGRAAWAYKAGSSRPASALSVFPVCDLESLGERGSVAEVFVDDIHLRSKQPGFGKAPGGGQFHSFGAMLFDGHRHLRVSNCSVGYEPPSDRPVVIIKNCRSVDLDDLAVLEEGKIDIDGAEELRISGCYGPARVRVDGKDLGPLGSLTIGGGA